MKTLIAGANLPLPSPNLTLTFHTHISKGELDLSAYLLAEKTGQVRGDNDMIFYGQTHDPSHAISLEINANENIFSINTAKIDPEISKIKICATLDQAENFTAVQELIFNLESGGEKIALAEEQPRHCHESAMILCEIYRYQGIWKCRWVMQGFNHFHLKELAEHFGVEIAETAPPPTPQISPPAENIQPQEDALSPPPKEITLPTFD